MIWFSGSLAHVHPADSANELRGRSRVCFEKTHTLTTRWSHHEHGRCELQSDRFVATAPQSRDWRLLSLFASLVFYQTMDLDPRQYENVVCFFLLVRALLFRLHFLRYDFIFCDCTVLSISHIPIPSVVTIHFRAPFTFRCSSSLICRTRRCLLRS